MSKIVGLSGFPEYLPADRIVEQHFLDTIRAVFELHGFSSLETRSVEPIGRLSAQGEDTDKEIFVISRLGGDNDKEPALGLHFDQTVPLARYVLEHAGKLHFPFRRYQMQKVWRGERPQEGRYREFLQADIDIIDRDTLSGHFEAEIPLVIADVFSRLPMPDFIIGVNNRKISEGFYRGLGLENVVEILRIIDKLDKIGPDKVLELLQTAGSTPQQATQCLRLAQIQSDDLSFARQVRDLGVDHPLLDEGLADLVAVMESAIAVAPGKIRAELKIARGLDYYTGTVYETTLVGHEKWGSVCSGGRYDSLASDGKTTYPGVGISIGVSRLLGLLFGAGLVRASRSTPAAVLVAVVDDSMTARAQSTAIATALRGRGIACEVAPRAAKFGKQIRYADRRGIPFVWFPAAALGDDVASDEVKDIRSGQQQPVDAATWMPPIADMTPSIESGPDKHS